MLEAVIAALKAEQDRVAHDALSNPGTRDLFGYGFAVGHYDGLAAAISAVKEMYADDERRNDEM